MTNPPRTDRFTADTEVGAWYVVDTAAGAYRLVANCPTRPAAVDLARNLNLAAQEA